MSKVKIKKVVVFLPILLITLSISSCGNGNTSKANENITNELTKESSHSDVVAVDDFFEGIFTPGTLEAKYYSDIASPCSVRQVLTINKDHSFVMKVTEAWRNSDSETHIYRGTITKHKENYNGVEHIWYALEGESGNRIGSWSIEANGKAVGGNCRTYSEVYSRLTDNRSSGWHWEMTRSSDGEQTSLSSNPGSNSTNSATRALSFQDKLARIKNGMSESDVIAIMGTPNDRLDNYVPGFQNLIYRSGSIERIIRLQNGKVFEIMNPDED